MSQSAKLYLLLHRHSGLGPWFDRLTTLSEVEGESRLFQALTFLDAGSSPA